MKSVPHPLTPEMRSLTLKDLAWLTASFAVVITPHVARAPWWLMLLTVCLFGWRFIRNKEREPAIPVQRGNVQLNAERVLTGPDDPCGTNPLPSAANLGHADSPA